MVYRLFWGFSWFSSVSIGKYQTSKLKQVTTAYFHVLNYPPFMIVFPSYSNYITYITETTWSLHQNNKMNYLYFSYVTSHKDIKYFILIPTRMYHYHFATNYTEVDGNRSLVLPLQTDKLYPTCQYGIDIACILSSKQRTLVHKPGSAPNGIQYIHTSQLVIRWYVYHNVMQITGSVTCNKILNINLHFVYSRIFTSLQTEMPHAQRYNIIFLIINVHDFNLLLIYSSIRKEQCSRFKCYDMKVKLRVSK
jgi:hypothetical protein